MKPFERSLFIFVSCGQYTQAEKALGKNIVKMVKDITGLDAFFAEDVQDLNGLDSNILTALRDCSAFITVMHPRGKIARPDGSAHIRASVWIEQEIAIATYIRRTEQRELPVIAFIHKSVGREGIRDLLHLNPVEFTDEMEVLSALPERLRAWRTLNATGIVPQVQTTALVRMENEHQIRQLSCSIVNNTNSRITQMNGTLRLPAGILKHWRHKYPTEDLSNDSRYRVFRFDEKVTGDIYPQSTRPVFILNTVLLAQSNSPMNPSTLGVSLCGNPKWR